MNQRVKTAKGEGAGRGSASPSTQLPGPAFPSILLNPVTVSIAEQELGKVKQPPSVTPRRSTQPSNARSKKPKTKYAASSPPGPAGLLPMQDMMIETFIPDLSPADRARGQGLVAGQGGGSGEGSSGGGGGGGGIRAGRLGCLPAGMVGGELEEFVDELLGLVCLCPPPPLSHARKLSPSRALCLAPLSLAAFWLNPSQPLSLAVSLYL